MDFFTEYGLLVAVAMPVAVVVALQVYLFIAGERGTLLLPSLKPYERVAYDPTVETVAEVEPPRTVDDPLDRMAA